LMQHDNVLLVLASCILTERIIRTAIYGDYWKAQQIEKIRDVPHRKLGTYPIKRHTPLNDALSKMGYVPILFGTEIVSMSRPAENLF